MRLRRGEIWLIDLDPNRKGEIGKSRSCVIVSDNEYNASSAVLLIMPISSYPPTVRSPAVIATAQTGLSDDSSVLPLHIRAVARSRFIRRIGRASLASVDQAVQILALIISVD